MEDSAQNLDRYERFEKRREIFKQLIVAADMFDELYSDNASATLDFHRTLRNAQYIVIASENLVPDDGTDEEEE